MTIFLICYTVYIALGLILLGKGMINLFEQPGSPDIKTWVECLMLGLIVVAVSCTIWPLTVKIDIRRGPF